METGEFADTEGTVDIPAQAVNGGQATNVPSNYVTVVISAPSGVTGVTNPGLMSGGAEEETDTVLRERLRGIFGATALGVRESYERWAFLASQSVTRVSAVGQLRAANSVDVFITGLDGAAASGLVSTVQDFLDYRRALTDDLVVQSATIVPIDVSATVWSDGSKSEETLETDINVALAALLNWFTADFAASIGVADITSAINSVEGVVDVDVTLPAATTDLDAGELPEPGDVVLTFEA